MRLSFILCLCLGLLYIPGLAEGDSSVKTPAEAANYTLYSQHEQISHFLSLLDSLSEELNVQIVGRSLGREEYGAKDLYLCILSEEGICDPQKINREKPTFYLVAAKHGNEQSAKEALLWLIRDLAVGELKPLLKEVNFLILPQSNPYGNWFDQRRNEQNLDLNRDHVKLEAPETETINRVFRLWMPEVTLDVHEKGDDYYRVSIGCVSNVNIHNSLQTFSREKILAEVGGKLDKEEITFHEYLITQEMGIDSSAGVTYPKEDLEGREEMKRYSTTDLNDGRNSPGIYETLSFIQEGASRHDIVTLKDRTRYQYFGIRFLAESVALHGKEIVTLVRNLRTKLLDRASTYSDEDLVHLRMKYARNPEEPTLTIKKFEQSQSRIRGILNVDKKAGDMVTSSELDRYPYPNETKVVDEVVKNWFPEVEPIISISRPLGYIVPAEHQGVLETLLRHGIQVQMFTKNVRLDIESYQLEEVIPADYDYLPPMKINVSKKAHSIIVKKGDVYVPCAQLGANLIPCLLEPQSQYGFIRYWKFNLVLEKGNIYPFYRVITPQEMPLIPYRNWNR
jgi:dipeptidyl-peptidase-4